MSIDWNAVATIAAPVITLFLGVWVNRRFENRPMLISYFSHVSAFRHNNTAGQASFVHTHSVVLRNTGRQSATNVRLHHAVLPDFNIWPDIAHQIDTMPNGSKDIVIPILVPGEQITISYLYFPPLTFDQIHSGIKCDQGFARQISVLLQRQYPRWFNVIASLLVLVGVITTIYFIYLGARAM